MTQTLRPPVLSTPERRARPVPRAVAPSTASPPRALPVALSVAPTLPPSDAISAFIELQAEARGASSLETLKFAIVNATRKMAPYDQAFLLLPRGENGWRVALASSVARVDRDASVVRAVEDWAAGLHAEAGHKSEEVHALELPVFAGLGTADAQLRHGMWVPIRSRRGAPVAVLLALKQEDWRPQHAMLLTPLAGAYGHAWEALAPLNAGRWQRGLRAITARRFGLAVALILALGAVVPVPMSALAPAEVVAASPGIVTAPLDGVVRDILVPPGTLVQVGTPLIRFVDTKLRNDVEIASRSKSVAEARYFKAMQSALSTHKELEDIAIAQGELAVAQAELAAAGDLLARSDVRADRAGLVIYAAASDWIGKPVQVGERIMEIGDPAHVELRIDLPVSDAVALKQGSPVSLFLDGDPLRPIAGMVERMSYRPILSADQQMVYRIHASFEDHTAQRIGLRGTARVSGAEVPLWFYVLRRPLSALRQRVGL